MNVQQKISLIMMALLSLSASAQIDMHSHAITDGYRRFITEHGAAMDEGFPLPQWDAQAHVDFMDAAGIAASMLTMPAPQPYFGSADEAATTCRQYNEECARLAMLYPGRFLFCAALPLPDVQAAMREAAYALDTLHAVGVKIATNSYGQYLGDEALDPLMEMLDRRSALIILHPHKPSAVNNELIATVPMATYEYLAETTRALLNMMSRNVLVRHPNLRVVVPHCGSFLPAALPRFRLLLPVMVAQGLMQPVDIDAQLSHLWFDLAGAPTDEALDALLAITTPDHLLYGSDYPYVSQQALTNGKQALELRLIMHGIDPQQVLATNAQRLLGADIPPSTTGDRMVRVADIEVHPEHLEAYLAFAHEVGETSIATEPGVLTLYSMQDKSNPTHILILEIYADSVAYQHHLQTPHFKKYKEATAQMVKSLRLVDTTPVAGRLRY